MLRLFAKHFNDTVFRGPDTEGGSDVVVNTENDAGFVSDGGGDDDSPLPDDGDGGAEGGEPSKPLTVREQLKRSIAEANEDAANQARSKKDPKTGRFSKGQAAPGQVDPAAPPQAAPAVSATPAPNSLSKEARAEWDKTPPAIQQAFIKREEDSARGVAELKQQYELIDKAIAPHQDALRQMNATPGDAVNRLFLWFKALAGAPAQSFPELAKSMGYDWAKVVAATTGQQPAAGQQQPGAQQPPEIPEPVRNYVGQLEQRLMELQNHLGQIDNRFGAVQQDLNATNEAKTRENLSIWSKDKEFYEDVRKDMANFIQSGLIPLKNGQVDLDTAYERAIYYNPEVRTKVLAKQQQANQQVQQTADAATTAQRQGQVARARKAAVSLPVSNAPGSGNGQVASRKPGQKGISVRDSLKAAMAELRDQ